MRAYPDLPYPLPWPFNCKKWSTCHFSLWYPYIIQQTSYENTQPYQVEVIVLIELLILITYSQGNV